MVNSCFLCNKQASRTENISLHKFPKNVELRIKWLNASGLTTNDDVRRTCICSRHFEPEDICQSNIFGNVKSSIKRNAVPTLHLRDPFNVNENNKSPPKTPLSELFDENRVANKLSSFLPDNDIGNKSNALDSTEKSPEKYVKLNSNNMQMANKSSIDPDSADFQEKSNSNLCLENRMADSNIEGESTVADENNSTSQHRKRKFFEPRHISEISSVDFATPKRTKRTILLIKTTDQKKSQKIKQLQRQTRDLLKRIHSSQDLINHLKSNRMLTHESGDALMV